jgi:phosphatidylglycerophosphate synthase
MLDRQLRNVLGPGLEATGRRLAGAGVRPGVVTAVGWLIGVGACVAAATGKWYLALALWLANRLLDGLDGPVARATSPTAVGGFLDIVADFSIYGGFVVAVAFAEPAARLACGTLLLGYYVSGTAFLALSSLLERRGQTQITSDRRSLRFVGGLAEGAETIVVYVLFCLFPHHADIIAWVFAGVVAVTALQRVLLGVHLLKSRERPARATGGRPQ